MSKRETILHFDVTFNVYSGYPFLFHVKILRGIETHAKYWILEYSRIQM